MLYLFICICLFACIAVYRQYTASDITKAAALFITAPSFINSLNEDIRELIDFLLLQGSLVSHPAAVAAAAPAAAASADCSDGCGCGGAAAAAADDGLSAAAAAVMLLLVLLLLLSLCFCYFCSLSFETAAVH